MKEKENFIKEKNDFEFEKESLKRRKRKFNNKKAIIGIIFAVVLIYIVYAIYLLVKEPTDKVMVEQGTLYQEETDIGYIIRNEQIVKGNNYKNGMEQIKTEGEKTAKGESIYRYYSQNEQKLKEQIAEYDLKIQDALKGQTNVPYSDVKQLENQLDEKIEKLNKMTSTSEILEYKKQISDIITKKAKISGETSTAGSYLKQLYTERTKLEQQLNSGAEYIKAPESGIVFYKVDGFEETLTPNNFSALNKEFLEKLKLKTGQLIATNDECGKIIDISKCYIATISDSGKAKEAKLNNKVQIRLANSKIIDAKITYLSQENEDEVLIILEVDKQINELANYRKISFELIWWSSTGLKVPNQAIKEEDGLNYVVKNRAGYYDKILVKVQRKNDKYSIVTNYDTDELKELGVEKTTKISIYDEIMLNPDLNSVNE